MARVTSLSMSTSTSFGNYFGSTFSLPFDVCCQCPLAQRQRQHGRGHGHGLPLRDVCLNAVECTNMNGRKGRHASHAHHAAYKLHMYALCMYLCVCERKFNALGSSSNSDKCLVSASANSLGKASLQHFLQLNVASSALEADSCAAVAPMLHVLLVLCHLQQQQKQQRQQQRQRNETSFL